MGSECASSRKAKDPWSCSATAFLSPGVRGEANWGLSLRLAFALPRPTCVGTAEPTRPRVSDAYTMVHHAGDMAGLVQALGESQAIIVGHDWGAPVAWTSALLRPDMFRSVVGMSVPYAPPSKTDLLKALELNGVRTFYMQYFQEPGVAEAELSADVEATIRRVTFSMSGDGPGRVVAGILPPGSGFLDATIDPETPPPWMKEEDLREVAEEFRRTGFTGGLN